MAAQIASGTCAYCIIRIYHECEGGIDKKVQTITVPIGIHEACRVITNVDREGRSFPSHPHTNNGVFMLTIKYRMCMFKNAP